MGVVDQVKDRLDLVELVSTYVTLDKSGRNFKALCPFHDEKTPSFVVFPDSQRWHCFGACNEGGDVFNFVMKMEGWDFRTALQELAAQSGVELEPPSPAQAEAADLADRLRDALRTATHYYHHALSNAPEAEPGRAYVEARGLDADTVEAFQLGYSPPGWERLRTYLLQRDHDETDLVKAGLLVEREGGGTYDRFRERLMIPIRDARGRVIGFGARTLDPDGVPKYLNSPNTPVFDKGETLFGLDMARRAIRREDQVIIVEGYMDVMQAHQAGYQNVVAQMGTALSEPKLRQLRRYTDRLVLALDPDTAGVQATLRGVEVARDTLEKRWQPVFDPRGLVGYEGRLDAELRVLQLPNGKDPDDVIRDDQEQWAALVDQALPVVDFYLQLLTADADLTDTKVKARIVGQLLPVLGAVANPVEQEDYAQKIARSLRIDERAVLAQVRQEEQRGARRRRSPGPKDDVQQQSEKPQSPPEALLERHCVATLLRRSGLLDKVNGVLLEKDLEPVRPRDFEQASLRAAFEAWHGLLRDERPLSLETLKESLPRDVQSELDRLMVTDDLGLADEQLVRDFVLTLLRLRERRLKAFVQDLRLLMLEARDEGDARGKQYDQAHLAHTQKLLRTQRALARSRELG